MKNTTRKDYLAGKISHQEFYGSVVKESGIKVGRYIDLDRVRKALKDGDEPLNTIPLREWDLVAITFKPLISKTLKTHGDFYSDAGGVCTVKEAAKQEATETQ